MQSKPAHFHLNYRETLGFYTQMLGNAEAVGINEVNLIKRGLGSCDLFFLLVFILKREDALHPWLFRRCREVQLAPNDHLDLWAREHYKSTVITFALTIFDIINDPEITIGIFSHTKGVAKKFLIQIKFEFEMNEDLKTLWPEIFYENPAKEAQKWSEDVGIIVNRKTNPKEATVEAHGLVDGQPTGRHFKLRVYDDVVTMESVSTPAQIEKTTYAWQMSDNLGSDGGHVRYIGTRYHLFDTYSTMMESAVVKPRIRPATKDGTELGEPVLLGAEYLAKKRATQGPYVFASQMLLNPVADKAMGFSREWLEYGDVEEEGAMRSLWRMIIVDPAGGKQRKNNDFTTFFVIGHGEDEKYRVLEIRRDRMNLSKRGDTLFELHRKWKPQLVAYEEYGMQADIEHYKILMKRDLYEFEIQPLGGSMPKPLRILRLIPYFEQRRIILPTTCLQVDYQGHNRDLVRDFIEQEYLAFPVLKHDDMMDCLARLVDLEAAALIQKPAVLPAPTRNLGINQGLRNIGRQGADSWATA